MIEQTGQVVAVEGDRVFVNVEPHGACHSCSARRGCGQRLMAELGGPATPGQVRLYRTLPVDLGDQVAFGVAEQELLWASLRVYFFPLVGLIVGAAGGTWIFGADEIAVALSAAFVMAVVFVLSRFSMNGSEIELRLLRVLPPAPENIPLTPEFHAPVRMVATGWENQIER